MLSPQEFLGPRYYWVPKKLGYFKILGPKKIVGSRKICIPKYKKKNWVPKKFGSQRNVESKKNVGSMCRLACVDMFKTHSSHLHFKLLSTHLCLISYLAVDGLVADWVGGF